MKWKLLSDMQQYLRENPRLREQMPELKRVFWHCFGLQVLCEVVLVAQIYPVKYIFDSLVNPQYSVWYTLRVSFLVYFFYTLGTWLFNFMSNARNDFYHLLKAIIRDEARRQELRLSTDWHIAHGTGEKEALIAKNIAKVSVLLDETLFNASPVVLRIVCTTTGMFLLGWYYGVIATLCVLTYAVVLYRVHLKVTPIHIEYHEEEKFLERHGSELTQQWRSIRTMGLEESFAERNAEYLHNARRNEQKRHPIWRREMAKLEHSINISRLQIYALGAVLAKMLGHSVGGVILAMEWMNRIYSNFHRLTEYQRHLQQGSGALRELMTIFLTKPSVAQAEKPLWPESVEGGVVIENLSFTYPEGSRKALSGVSLTVKPGQIVALIGQTGSGKTTLASLLMREYDPCEGRILIDGVDLRELDYERFRKEALSVVPQTASLFDDTVRANIRVSRMDAEPGEEEWAAKQAFAHEFIDRMPNGYDTLIGENGVRLSGGQRQRLAIARALHRKSKILVLDEPTSALDADSQAQVQKAIDRLTESRDCTIFIIAHRFSTIMRADLVVVMKEGHIEEIGTHEELARMNGLYMHYRNLEIGGYLSPESVAA
jgi:ABC-type multidrug transport system fused ATPase/permease subunit